MPRCAAGVDGCKAGWIAVIAPLGDLSSARAFVARSMAEILTQGAPAILAVDMPIGLPDHNGAGRLAERELRAILGPRRSSVFPIPSRAAVFAEDYAKARQIALATSDPPRSIAKQAFNIFPKIREIDALARQSADVAARLFECHPEGSFRMMQGAPLAFAKRHPSGAEIRRRLLLQAGFAPGLIEAPPPSGAAPDDLLDACAAAWTAQRIAAGAARRWPQEIVLDAHGLPMAIWT